MVPSVAALSDERASLFGDAGFRKKWGARPTRMYAVDVIYKPRQM